MMNLLNKNCRFCEGNNIFEFNFNNLYFPTKNYKKWKNVYCKSCGSVSHYINKGKIISYADGSYRNRNVKPTKIDNKFFNVFPPIDPWSTHTYYRWIEIYSNLIKFTNVLNKNVALNHLDYGGYNGFLPHALAQILKINSTVADLDKRGLNIASSLGFETIDLSIKNIPSDKKYDLITMIHVLEHIDEPKKLLLSLKNSLESKGILYIEVPNLFGIPMQRESHISSFTLESFIRNMPIFGFTILKSGFSQSTYNTFDFGFNYISKKENIYVICTLNNKEVIDKKVSLFKNKNQLIKKLNYEYSKISLKNISSMHLKKVFLHFFYFLIYFFPALIDFIFVRFINISISFYLLRPLNKITYKILNFFKK